MTSIYEIEKLTETITIVIKNAADGATINIINHEFYKFDPQVRRLTTNKKRAGEFINGQKGYKQSSAGPQKLSLQEKTKEQEFLLRKPLTKGRQNMEGCSEDQKFRFKLPTHPYSKFKKLCVQKKKRMLLPAV